MTADEAKEFLSNLSVEERIAAVAEDVESDEQRFASIEANDLAELLGVPQPEVRWFPRAMVPQERGQSRMALT